MHYRVDIDGLRAVAVLLVLGFHVGLPGMSAGFVGVDIFFVISGYLITRLLKKELESDNRIDIVAFYARRVRRLLPVIFTVVLTVICCAVFLLHPFGQQQELAKSALASIFFVANVYFARTTGGYFDAPDSEVPLLHFWSLAVEEQFYLFWPLCIVLLAAIARFLRAQVGRTLIIGCMAIALGSLTYALFPVGLDEGSAYYLLPSRAWQLLFGSSLGMFPTGYWRELPKYMGKLLYLVGIVGLILALFSINGPHNYPGIFALLPVISACALLVAGELPGAGAAKKILTFEPVVFIGKISFSLYLWHWPLISIGQMYSLGVHSVERNILLVLAAFVLSCFSYYFVELRFRSAPLEKKSQRIRLFGTATLMLAFTIIAASMLGFGARHAKQLQPWWHVSDDILKLRHSRPKFRRYCHLDAPFVKLPERSRCTLGIPEGDMRILLWGDSHADHLSPLLDKFSTIMGVAALQRSFSACRPVVGLSEYMNESKRKACSEFNAEVLKELNHPDHSAIRGVVLGGFWGGDFEAITDSRLYQGAGNLAALKDGGNFHSKLKNTIATLSAKQLKVLLIEPLPVLPFNPVGCLARFDKDSCKVARGEGLRVKENVSSVFRQLARDNENVRVVDLTNFFCDDAYCYAVRDDQPIFRDSNHLAPGAAEALLPFMKESLLWVMGGGADNHAE